MADTDMTGALAAAADHDSEMDSGLPAIHLLIVLSLGRSGSTFVAKALSQNSDFVNGGENRFFWQELVTRPPEEHPAEIARFFARKPGFAGKALDKTPEIYRYLDQVNFGPHQVDLIELVRNTEAIARSRDGFIGTLRKPKRWLMRIRKYRQDYGTRWYVPILQRWYFVPAMLGLGRNRAFATGSGDSSAAGVAQERRGFDAAVARLRTTQDVTRIDYDAFADSVRGLAPLGFSDAQIAGIAAIYKAR
ncbi:hypothetical protein GGQ68_004813 [Sagittula marina]|uniref:LPS sulfotransferase NodH n=1 Tax=Sagittula marina TaxID=943940 RepID=A0A7W6GUD6_9RHOB|nr:hypothetical protein [Sagittula marina]MBB3988456.1 hypothetical protein [Sagittula marina]